MKTQKIKKCMSLFLAALMCVTTLFGMRGLLYEWRLRFGGRLNRFRCFGLRCITRNDGLRRLCHRHRVLFCDRLWSFSLRRLKARRLTVGTIPLLLEHTALVWNGILRAGWIGTAVTKILPMSGYGRRHAPTGATICISATPEQNQNRIFHYERTV